MDIYDIYTNTDLVRLYSNGFGSNSPFSIGKCAGYCFCKFLDEPALVSALEKDETARGSLAKNLLDRLGYTQAKRTHGRKFGRIDIGFKLIFDARQPNGSCRLL